MCWKLSGRKGDYQMQATFEQIPNLQAWINQIAYYRTHLDCFIVDIFGFKLSDVQRIMARNIGNFTESNFVASRGAGKTLTVALSAAALAVLYPGIRIAVASGIIDQANLTVQKLQDPITAHCFGLRNEIDTIVNNKGKLTARFINKSVIECYSVSSMRGIHVKAVILDEAPEVKEEDVAAIVAPITMERRPVTTRFGWKDFPSKIITLTSAPLKSSYYYKKFVRDLTAFSRGDKSRISLAFDWKAAVRTGVNTLDDIERRRASSPQSIFDMEFGSIFVGAEANSIFPYDLIESCRTNKAVETRMPHNSKSDYIMSIDFAPTGNSYSDNTVITVLKLFERSDGSYKKNVVQIRSFKGLGYQKTVDKIHEIYVRFPNIVKVVFDYNGPGNSLKEYFIEPWINPETGREMPGWVFDDTALPPANTIAILRGVVGTVERNQKMVNDLLVALERRLVALPINSRIIFNGEIVEDDDEDEGKKKKKSKKKLRNEELAIFLEADALQIEMGTIVSKRTPNGSLSYRTARSSQKKDRFSSLGMAITFLAEIEEGRKSLRRNTSGDMCIGIVSSY